ncbi:MAG: DNA adenine methylase [Mucinivorans sp.]
MQVDRAKPFLKWVGGKTQLLSQIRESLPVPVSAYHTYVEPFVGGGAVLFYMLKNYKNIKHAIINDINNELITTYRTIKQTPNELIEQLLDVENEFHALITQEQRTTYFLGKRLLFNKNIDCPITKSATFIFLNKTCFNGLYRVNSKGEFNVPYGKYIKPMICDRSTILADSELLQRVEILCGDFSQTIDFADAGAIFYCDPPYKPISVTSSFNSYTKENFGDEQQVRLKSFCDNLTQQGAMVLQSNSESNSGYFDELYTEYKIERVFASRMVNSDATKRGKIKELLISNYMENNRLQLSLF